MNKPRVVRVPAPKITAEEDALFRLLRQVNLTPNASQRDIAAAVGISLGRLNAQLKAAVQNGFIKIADSASTDKRQRMSYTLTHRGAAEKTRLTDHFLARKFAEYDALHAELTGSTSGYVPNYNRIQTMQNNLAPIPELYVSYESAPKMKLDAADLTSPDLKPRPSCDLELLTHGCFNPSSGFLPDAQYYSRFVTLAIGAG